MTDVNFLNCENNYQKSKMFLMQKKMLSIPHDALNEQNASFVFFPDAQHRHCACSPKKPVWSSLWWFYTSVRRNWIIFCS